MHRPGHSKPWGRCVGSISALVVILMTASFVVAQDGDSSNAATWYRRAYERLDRITPEQWTLLIEYQKIGGPPSAEVRGILQRAQPALADLRRAANQSYSDFGLDYSKGVNMETPHLRGVRNLLRVASADAAMRIADGDGTGAATEITSLCRMVDHVSGDRVLSSSILAGAVFNMTNGLVDAGYDAAAFSNADSAMLLNTMRSFDGNDPFGAADAIVAEQFMNIQTIRNAVAAGDQAAFDQFADIYGLNETQRTQLVALNPEQLQAGLDAHSRLMDQYVAAFGNEDHEAALAEVRRLDRACADGEFGLIASVLRADFALTYGFLDKVRGMLHERIDVLKEIAGGEVSASDLANAAVWYRRGIEKLETLDDAWTRAIAQVDPSRPLDDVTIKALEDGTADAEAAVAEFVEGSKIRRCDFSKGRNEREVFVPIYADGMRDAFRLLTLESLRQKEVGDHAAAAHLVSAALRMAAHLSDDRLIVSSLVSRDGFLLAAQAGQALSQREMIDLAVRTELSAAIRRNGVGDAFGFIAASAHARKAIRTRLLYWAQGEDRELLGAKHEAWLAQVDADGLVSLLAMQDVMDYDLQLREPFNRPGAQRLSDLLLAETIELAEIDALGFRKHLKQRQPQAFDLPATIHLVGASEKAASARQELWDAVRWERELETDNRPVREPQP